jgi:hypothetical protein
MVDQPRAASNAGRIPAALNEARQPRAAGLW